MSNFSTSLSALKIFTARVNTARMFWLALILCCFSLPSIANITVTPGSGGTNICANKAVGGLTPAYTTLGTITVAEGANNDFGGGGTGFNTITLTAPAGWQFNTAATPVLTGTNPTHFTNLMGTSFTSTTYVILVRMTATAATDNFTITGLQVQATGTGSAAGTIRPTAMTGTFTGIVVNTTNFASLSLTPSLTPSVTIAASPAGPICAGTSVTFTATPVNGDTPYAWSLNGAVVPGATSITYTNASLASGNTIRVRMTATGCVNAASANSNTITMVVNPLPAAVTVSGGGAFCTSTTITASNGGSGTMYYQGVISGGTSTATPATSMVINTPGVHTYYFRARSASGCWGTEGSTTVTINPTPSAFTPTPSSATVCLGDSATFIGGATIGDVNIINQDFNSGLGAWTITNISGTTNSYFQIRNSPGYLGATNGDGTPMMEAAADATGTGVVTNSLVTSPSFSLAGFSSANVTFNQYYRIYTDDSTVAVEYSIDGGITWSTILDQLGIATGTTTWNSLTPTTTIALPAAVIGQPNVMLRWNYKTLFGWYWALDNISVQGVPDLTYTWTGIAGASGITCTTCDTTAITPAVTGTNVYSVFATYGGCTSSSGVTIDVNPLPLPITGTMELCANAMTTLADATTGGDWTSTDPSVATIGMAGGDVAAIAAGTTTISYTLTATGCAVSSVFTVDPLPVIAPITGNTGVCVGSTATLASLTAGGVWTSSDVTAATIDPVTGEVVGLAAGMPDITYTVTTALGCTDFVTAPEMVNPLPVVSAISGLSAVCEASIIALTDATPGGVWSSSDATIAIVDAMTGVVTGEVAGAATIYYTVTDVNGCVTTVSQAETVNPMPVVTPIIGDTNVCAGLTMVLADLTAGGTWNSTDATVATVTSSGVVTGVAFGAATISYTIVNSFGCVNAASLNITIGNTMPAILVTPAAASVTLCHGNPVNIVTTTSGSGLTYQWAESGNPIAGATNTNYIADTTGFYAATVDNGTCHIVLPTRHVIAAPNASIAYNSAGGFLYTGSFAGYQWLHNGAVVTGANSSIYSGPVPGLYSVVVNDVNGCTDTSASYLIAAGGGAGGGGGSTGVGATSVADAITVYPVPASTSLYISAPVAVNVKVNSPDGKLVMEQKSATNINVENLANGVYLISIFDTNNNLLSVQKFSKVN